MSMPAQPFDVAGLRDALPVASPVQRTQIGGVAGAAWATDFLAGRPATSQTHLPTQVHAQGWGHGRGHVQAQGIPATRVQGSALPVGGIQGASGVFVRRSVQP